MISAGQRVLSTSILGGGLMGGYSAYDKYANDNFMADPKKDLMTGVAIGGAVGLFGNYKGIAQGVSKKFSTFTNPTGASSATNRIFNNF